MLTAQQLEDYRHDGYLLLRGAIPEADIVRLERGLERNPPTDGTLEKLNYPEPGRYTLATNSLKDPDLAFIVEHEAIVPAAGQLLGDEPKLTAYVIYDRTPGGGGLPAHNDYKRWRPVGSSMNWLFTIIPFCDYNADTGRLFVAPGSHQLERVRSGDERALQVSPPSKPDEGDFIDPELERGDLLFMNMYLWHRAEANSSDQHRVGVFNKYAAAGAPPATGYFLYDDDVYNALSPEGRKLIAVHSDRRIETTRLVLVRPFENTTQVLMAQDDDGRWSLPGGATFVEQAIPDWDEGNVIASLQSNLREGLRIETPWVSYVGDFEEGDHLCRVYGYTLNDLGFPVKYEGRWFAVDQLASVQSAFGYEAEAVHGWLDPTPVRGKGITQAQSRVDQYAF
jgi:hypothetical protein